MARKYNIKWSEADEKELKRVVRNYNAKINRVIKKNPELKNSLPTKLTSKDVSELKSWIVTRQDFNRELNSLKRFSNKGAEDMLVILSDGSTIPQAQYERNPSRYPISNDGSPVKISRWEKTEINRRIPVVNKQRALEKERLEKIEVVHNGKKVGYTIGDIGMDSNLKNALLPLKGITGTSDNRQIKSLMRNLKRQSQSGYLDKKTAILRENYIKALGDYYGTGADAIVNHIDSLSDEEFLKVFYENKDAGMEIASPKSANKHIEAENLTMLKNAWLGSEK